MRSYTKKKLLTGLLPALFGFMAGIAFQDMESHAVNTVYDTALEAAYTNTYKDIFYDKTAGSPLEAETEEGVDTSNGHLILRRTDLYLEGTGGMDFELSRYYNSNNANIGSPMAEHVDSLKVKTYNVFFQTGERKKHSIAVAEKILNDHPGAVKGMLVNYNEDETKKRAERTETDTQRTKVVSGLPQNVYGISTGWAFDLPWIETMTVKSGEGSGWAEKPVFLHMGSTGTMAVSTQAEEKTKSYTITGLENYPYEDIKLETINRKVDGTACRYFLRDKTGMRTYFNQDGVVVLQKDAHGNTIRYTYRDKIYFDTITDSVGRKIQFHYGAEKHGMRFLEKITVEGTKTTGGVSGKTIKYSIKETSYTTMDSTKLYGSTLNQVTVGRRKEKYSYRTVESLVNTAGAGVASQRAATNETYLIKSVERDGSTENYEYRAGAVRGIRDAGAGQKRDIVTQFFYVTREYEQDIKTKKKTGGIKYDYFQKQKGKIVTFDDLDDEKHEAWQYGEEGLQTVSIVSSYSPKKHKDNGKMSDYTYKREKLDTETLQLKNKPAKQVSLYQYNQNRLIENETEESSGKNETLYQYDRNGAGSLVVLETEKRYGKKRSGRPKTIKRGFAYDRYRNVVTEMAPKAYLPKYKGKESLFTQHITYFDQSGGYPKEDKGYTLSAIKTCESHTSASVKYRTVNTLTPDGTSIAVEEEQMKKGNTDYQTLNRVEYTYDAQGNEIKGVEYPDRVSDPESYTSSTYKYNGMGQLLQQERGIYSSKDSSQNKTYRQATYTYDFFGNELTMTDENGMTDKTTYDEETGAEDQVTYAAGSPYEASERSYTSEDLLSNMTLDQYGRCIVEIMDAFGNVIIRKDEGAGIWIESEYDYGEGGTEGEEEEESEMAAPETRLVEERIYPFDPSGEAVTKSPDGTEEVHYDISGKGKEVLSASRHTYDDYGEEVVSAEFSGGAVNAAHCSSWTVSRTEKEPGDEQTISTTYEKELDPSAYQEQVDMERYYTQFDSHILSETVTVTVTDEEGNIISETATISCDGEKREIVTTSEYDDFGITISDHTTIQDYKGGKWNLSQETKNSYEYDDRGNPTVTTTQSRLSGTGKWEQQITKNNYDTRGQLTESYTPRGAAEGYATKYGYDLQGRQTQEWRPVEKENGTLKTQLITTEYDDQDRVTAVEEQLTTDTSSRTEYTYNEEGELTCVKTCPEDGKPQYVQYAYDVEGNQIRQFTGMTEPLDITVCEGEGKDSYTYAGKKYHIEVTGGNKKDNYSETKYTYNKKNQLTSVTDPEGNKETYTYDVYGNQTRMVDRNGDTTETIFDYQGRMVSQTTKDHETGEEISHTCQYDKYGNLVKADGITYTYNNLTERIVKEEEKAAGKVVQKTYTYDGGDNCRSFQVSAGGKTALSLSYEYDGLSRLTRVNLHDGSTPEEIAAYTYDQDGSLITSMGGKEGPSTSYAYNCAGDVISLTNQTGSGKDLSSYTAAYQLNGQKTSEKEKKKTKEGKKQTEDAAYTYDRMGRLLTESHTGEDSITYTYDSHNNRKTVTQGKKQTAYRYDRNDRLQRTDTLNTKTKEDAVALYKYDAAGNQLATVHRNETEEDTPVFDLNVTLGDNRLNDNVVNTYDAEDRLVRTLTGNQKATYTYNAEGYRASKTVNGKTTTYIWDGDQIILELDDKGEVSKRYLRGNSLICADTGKGTERQYYVTNPHGDTVQLVDKEGEILRQYDYDAFGNEIKEDKKDDNPFRYAGEYYDSETGNIYLRARYYAPGLGRFLTRDTYTGEEDDPLSLHLYTYCDNDGVNQVDPSGHWGKKKGEYVHQDLTTDALEQFSQSQTKKLVRHHNMIFGSGMGFFCTYTNEITLLDGCIYPDYIEAKKSLNREGKKKKIDKLNRFYKHINGFYKLYCRKTLLGQDLWDDNRLHGKNKWKLNALKNGGKRSFKCAGHKKEKILLLGCILHSIQDYQAHSYVSDLEEYKKKLEKNKGANMDEKERAFHSDWTHENGKIVSNGDEHKKNKDNPYRTFEYNNKKGKWKWRNVSKEKNPRYIEARNQSITYLKDTLKYLG